MSSDTNVGSTDESPQPPPRVMSGDKMRTKKWAPKTFNGCLTCKKRRIKCDEGKPACQRCIKSNIRCGGYAPPKIRLFDPTSSSSMPTPVISGSPPTARPAHTADGEPEPESESESELATTDISRLPTPTPSSSHPQELALLPRFGTQEEYQSFQFFLERTSNLISVYSQPYLWSVLLPQATWHQPSIKHSIIALASLHQSLTTSGAVSQRANHHFMFHYNHAIRALVADKPPVDIVLAACVIFGALENFNGSGQAALNHMKAAIKILGEWKTKRRPNDPANDLISKYIEPNIIEGVKFASEGRVEELAGQMSALSLTTRDIRIMSLSHLAFVTLEDAETYLADCISRILTLKSQTQAQTPSSLDRGALIEAIEQLDAELYKWIHLFQTLTATGPVYARQMLIVHNVAANILLDLLKKQTRYRLDEEERQADTEDDSPERCAHNSIVVEVEDIMCRGQVAAMDVRCNRLPGLSLIAPIFLVASTAQNFDTRQKAIKALRLLNTMEGPWCSGHASRIADAMLQIARECAVPASTVEWQHMSFKFDEEDQTLSMEWELEHALSSTEASVRTVDVPGMNWNGSETLELIRRYGYHVSPTPQSQS